MSKKIILDAGHGGEDPGAEGNGIIEKDYTIKITNYMYDRLKELDVPVFITRTEDVTLNPPKRIEKVKSLITPSDDVVLISNHLNAGGVNGQSVTNV